MFRPACLVTALLLLSSLARADDAASYQAMRSASAAASKPDVTASYGPAALNRGELRLPKGRGPFPVAVLLHGGCWRAGMEAAGGISALADALTARGFATWNVEFRQVGDPGGGWPGTFNDVAAGVDYLRTLAKSQPLDLSRVVLIGHSAGAHLALWAASRPKLHDPFAGADPLVPVAVVAIDGPGALAPFIGIDAQICGSAAIVPLMGGAPAAKPDAYRLATPADHLPLGVHQLLVLGDFAQLMQPYVAAARASGDAVDVLAPAGADHFDIITPSSPNGRQVVDFIATKALPAR